MLDPLSLVLGALAGVLVVLLPSWVIHHVSSAPAQTAAQRRTGDTYTCTCGQRFHAEQPAKEHAIETHNAHPDEWRPIMAVEA